MAKHGDVKSYIANLLAPTRYDQIVEAMGGYGEFVTEPDKSWSALERAGESGNLAMVNVMIDPKVFSGGAMRQTMHR